MTKGELASLFRQTLQYSTADQTEVLFIGGTSDLSRFANSSIHQNISEENVHLAVRAISKKRIGYASTNMLDTNSIKRTVKKAIAIAAHRAPDPDFVSLPKKNPVIKKDYFCQSTANLSPLKRAKIIKRMVDKVSRKKLTASGALSSFSGTIGVANSLGINASCRLTKVNLSMLVATKDSSGYNSFLTKDVDQINPEKIAEVVVEKALQSQNPQAIEAGKYTVILEPEAVADMISWLAVSGFSALAFQEKRSFVSGKLGQKITGKNITIVDDAYHPQTIGLPFDFEGTRKQKVTLIKNGFAKGVVYDSYTANKENKTSTGHALPPGPHGPIPSNLILASGQSSRREMVAATKKGILVSRFHYTNMEDPIRTILTGMTRDGTFLIENGKVKCGLKNLRFTQNILEALLKVEAMSRKRELKETFGFGACLVPTLKISQFNFTGTTEF